MIDSGPFAGWPAALRRRVFYIASFSSLVVLSALTALGAPMFTDAAPQGMVSFELARTLDVAQAMLASWSAHTQILIAFSLGLDYLFLLLYPLSIALGCALIAARLERRWAFHASVGFALAWLQPAAGVLDAVENYALVKLLLGHHQEFWPALAYYAAVPKFVIVGSGLLYAALAGAASLFPARDH